MGQVNNGEVSECASQTICGTFQGEIVGTSPLIIHLKTEGGIVTGFYKYPLDNVVTPLRGKIDGEGNLTLKGNKKLYPSFSGKLQGRLIEGSFMPSKSAKPHAFYACDFRGEYHSFSITLSDKGYVLKDESLSQKEGLITTHRQQDGEIFLQCDSLNAKLYLKGDSLVADTVGGIPLFMSPYDEGLVFTLMDGFFSGRSFIEFPEKNEERDPETKHIEVSGDVSIISRQIPRSQYITSMWETSHLRSKPYTVIKDCDQAAKMLRGRVKYIADNNLEGEEWRQAGVEIKYKDGTKRRLDFGGNSLKDYFIEYYPQLDVVILENEAGGDYPIDLRDSSNENYVGNPSYRATSPDGNLRINGYYPGGAYDTDLWFIEKWNVAKKKYEYIGDLPFSYAHGWFWVDNSTALFILSGGEENYYEMRVLPFNAERILALPS